jgi:hypothetical protein
VNLTFENAMKYNPKEHDVYLMGKTLSDLFKQKWEKDEEGITEKYRYDQAGGAQSGQQDTSTGSFPLTTNSDERAHVLSSAATACAPLPCSYALTSHSLSSFCPVLLQGKGRCGLVMVLSLACFAAGKRLMDSEFKDDRPMTYDEKRALSINMNKLPGKKLGSVVQIIHDRNHKILQPNGDDQDEIEIDIDKIDNETLRYLEHFVNEVPRQR